MIRDAQKHNENVTPKDFEIDVLMEALPHYFDGDGNFKMEKFQNMLQEEQVELSRESYELNFLGKSYARLLASLETETVIVPNEEHNADERNADSENIYITGDNLDALKHLAKSYRGVFDCVYADPPYNTGGDGFTYNDSFDFSVQSLVDSIGVTEEEAERILDLQGKASHSAWLTFMLPRLVLAKQLLSREGLLFLSIDDNELANLRMLCDEIFGEENFIADIIPISNPGGRDYTKIAVTNEHLLIYGTTPDAVVHEVQSDVEFAFEDSRGGFEPRELRNRNPKFTPANRPNLFYPFFLDPDSRDENGFYSVSLSKTDKYRVEVLPYNSQGAESVWRWGTKLAGENIVEGDIEASNVIGKRTRDGAWRIHEKNRRSTKKVKSVWDDSGMRTEDGTRRVRDLFGRTVFDHPKPINLLQRCVEMSTTTDSMVLDFFSGSGGTAEAVINLNATDGGNRTFVLMQIAEEIDPSRSDASKAAFEMGFKTIDEIGRKRIELAADKIKQDTGADIDYGFKHYTLKTPPQSVIDSLEDFAPDDNLFSDEPLESLDFDGTSADNVLLTTWIVQDGYGLNPEIEKVALQNYELTIVGNTAYAIDGGMSSDDIRVLTQKLEDGEIDITNFVYFHTAIGFERLRELDSALRHLRNRSSVTITARW